MTSVSKEFLDGVNEVFSVLLAKNIYLSLLDTNNIEVNDVYRETTKKVYKPPIQLVGSVKLKFETGEEVVESTIEKAEFRIPTKQFIINNIPYTTTEDLDILSKGMIKYDDSEYKVVDVKPNTNVDDAFLFHTFVCEKVKYRREL